MKNQLLADIFFSKGIQNNPSDLRSAWLILVTCTIAGLSLFGIIWQGFALEFTWSMVWILLGHSLVTFFPFVLRYFSSMRWPSRIFGLITIAQITNSIYQTGGMESEVFYAYAALPILLSFVLGLESILFNAILSFVGIFFIFYLDQIGHKFPNPQSTDMIDFCIILWGVLTSWVVGYYSRYQYVIIQEKLEDELQRRKIIQLALEEQHNNKDRFFAYLSHEIRNPLTSILGTTEKIVHNLTDEDIKRQMRRLQKSTFQVNEILEQVLDFSSMNTDQISLHMDHVDIIAFLVDMIELHRDVCDKYNVQIEIKKPLERDKIFIQVDYVRLQQVLSNLISNAIKFSDGEQPKIQIIVDTVMILSNSSNNKEADHVSMVRIICRDEGNGIAEKDLEKIFLPYQRSQSQKKGTGLGLAICKSLVEAMDGQISVESKLSEGTSFCIQFPEWLGFIEDTIPPRLPDLNKKQHNSGVVLNESVVSLEQENDRSNVVSE